MRKKQISFKTKGMNRDLSVSAFNPEFSYENMNLRLSTIDGNTTLSWVNEKGTLAIDTNVKDEAIIASGYLYPYKADDNISTIKGQVIGTAVINHQLVLFTTVSANSTEHTYRDRIYVLKIDLDKSNNVSLKGDLLYRGNLNFSTEHPIETLVSYESKDIQKVYWTDNYNQPRVINIAANYIERYKWAKTHKGTEIDYGSIDTFFDFSPSINFNEDNRIKVTKNISGTGTFSSGTIQYCYTYYNKNCQQSNIVDISPIYYITNENRGGSPEEKISSSFTITINNADTNFDYIRLYSIQRASVNSTPIVKVLKDFPIGYVGSYFIKYTYSIDDSLILPYAALGYSGKTLTDKQRVKTSEAINGNYTAVVDSSRVLFSFSNNVKNAYIVALDSNNNVINNIKTIQSLIDDCFSIVNVSLEWNRDIYNSDKYYTSITIDKQLNDELLQAVKENTRGNKWGISINNNVVFTDTDKYPEDLGTDEDGDKKGNYITFLYSYYNETWYVMKDTRVITSQNNFYSISDLLKVKENKYSSDGTTSITYTDNGIEGSIIDPTELLYIGSKDICAYTMIDKDNTLFLGNIKENNIALPYKIDADITFNRDKTIALNHAYGVYSNTHQIKNHSQREITTFKGGEWYRFGMQLQMANGQWSDPIYLGDKQNTLYPGTFTSKDNNDIVRLIQASANIDLTSFNIDYSKVKRVRPLVVYPSIGERSVICQGVVNPTVFNCADRKTNSPYAQASWFFRPYIENNDGHFNTSEKSNISDYITIKDVTTTSVPEDDNFDGYTTQMYCALVNRTLAESTNNKIRYHEDVSSNTFNNKTTEDVAYDGFIQISDTQQLLFRKKQWPAVGETTMSGYIPNVLPKRRETQTIKSYYDSSLNFAYIGTIGVYSDLVTLSPNNRYIYSQAAELKSLDTYILYISYGNGGSANIIKQITFRAVPNDFYVISNNVGDGNALTYKHYNPIPVQNFGKSAEIQGSSGASSIKSYNDKSNMDFFIDQSIVTLNSPDINFDPDVQSCNTDNFKMRIVGFIPITSNASAHHITYKNTMLPEGCTEDKNGIISVSEDNTIFGKGESFKNVIYTANPINVHAGYRLVADYLWNDTMPTMSNAQITTDKATYNYMIYPWQRSGSLNTDTRSADKCSSYLNTKVESTILYSLSSKYLDSSSMVSYDNIGSQMVLTDGAGIMNVRLPHQHTNGVDINYYPNIDKVLVNGDGYNIQCTDANGVEATSDKYPALKKTVNNPVLMKYKSTSHAVIDLCAGSDNVIPIMPNNPAFSDKPYWESGTINMESKSIDIPNLLWDCKFNYLWLGELYVDKDPSTIFGGKDSNTIKNNSWVIGGDAVTVTDPSKINLVWNNGDTYFQRYDCLKTYPYTNEDPNQIVEILSFMCETRVNIDGRYDRNRGQMDNTTMSPTNFNLFNPAYTQKDNFFIFKKASNGGDSTKYNNLITYTTTKTNGADVDQYTHVTLASIVEMDGDKGPVESLQRFNNNIIAFQDKGIAQILYNENVQLSTQNGVPIEIANSGKVQGKRYITDTIGCANKHTIVSCPTGIYFIDSYNKAIHLFNGQLKNLSMDLGFNSWSKKNIQYVKDDTDVNNSWTPVNFNGNFTAYYDSQNQDILFVNKDIALAYSERFNVFTSFYDYGNTPYLVNLDGYEIFIRDNNNDGSKFYLHNKGDYCDFFGLQKPYWITLVGNPEPQLDKVFTNLEFRATVDEDGEIDSRTYNPYLPFSNLETWNEYQHGFAYIHNISGSKSMQHHHEPTSHINYNGYEESLKRRYRIWRCDIPRDNADTLSDESMGIYRKGRRFLDRMRNPWIYIKLEEDGNSSNHRTEIHDITMTYFL